MPVDAESNAFARVAKRTRCATIEKQMQPSRIEMYECHSKIHRRCGYTWCSVACRPRLGGVSGVDSGRKSDRLPNTFSRSR